MKIMIAAVFYFLYWGVCFLGTGTDRKNLIGLRSYPDEVQTRVQSDTQLGQAVPFPEVVNGFMVQYQLAKMVKLAAPPVIIRGNFHLLTPFPWGVSRMILSVVRGLCWPWPADRLLFHLIFCWK